MATLDKYGDWTVREQIIDDPVSELTFQFEVMPGGRRVFRVFGNLPFGNREFYFDASGQEVGSSVTVRGLCKPTWALDFDR